MRLVLREAGELFPDLWPRVTWLLSAVSLKTNTGSLCDEVLPLLLASDELENTLRIPFSLKRQRKVLRTNILRHITVKFNCKKGLNGNVVVKLQ